MECQVTFVLVHCTAREPISNESSIVLYKCKSRYVDREEFVRVSFSLDSSYNVMFFSGDRLGRSEAHIGGSESRYFTFCHHPCRTSHVFIQFAGEKICFFSILQLHSMHTHVPDEKVCFVPTSGQKNNRQPYLFCTMCA